MNLFIWTRAFSLARIGRNGPLCCCVECISRQLNAAQPVYHSHVLSLSSSAVHDVSGPSMFMGVVPITPGWLIHTHVMQVGPWVWAWCVRLAGLVGGKGMCILHHPCV